VDAVLLVEWPERAGANAWPDALGLSLDFGEQGERILTAKVPPSWEGRWPPR
jgi:tRNA threonylcarbamoyladenosine biosynthesis protein TsaE